MIGIHCNWAGLDWQCCLAGSSKTAPRILIFSIAMDAGYSFYVKTIETHARTFLPLNISAIGTVISFHLQYCYEFCLVADTDDLWKFMSKSSGIDVGSLMNSWIRKMGFPVVVVTVIKTPDIDISGKITLKLTQHRFCGGNTNSPQKEPMLWSIPIQGDI